MAQMKNNPGGFLPLAQFQPHGALTRTYRFWFTAIGQTIQGPNIPVPPGATVTFRPIASNDAVNNASVYFSEHLESLKIAGAANVVPTGADVSLPFAVNNLQELFFAGGQNDGLIISVSSPAVG